MRLQIENTSVVRPFSKSVLVTGGGGYLGSVLVPRLLQEGYRVSVFDSFIFGKDSLAPYVSSGSLRLIEGELRSHEKFENLFQGIQSVIHLAAISNDPTGDLEPGITIETNIEATRSLALRARQSGVERFLFPSSCAVYGASGSTTLTENSLLSPITLYALSKKECEQELLPMANPNFCVTILRLATLFGLSPRMRFDLVLNTMVRHSLLGKDIVIDGNGLQYRPLLHVRDAAELFAKLLSFPVNQIQGKIYNVGRNELNFRICDLAAQIKTHFPATSVIKSASNTDQRSYRVCFSKLQRELNFIPTRTAADGIREITEAHRSGILGELNAARFSNLLILKDSIHTKITEKKIKPKVVAVILAHNCEHMLETAHQRIPKHLVDDILVMDDGSTDKTSEAAKRLGLKVFRNETNLGYGGNLKAGLKQAIKLGADFIVEVHGDGAQFDPKSIAYALPYLHLGADLVLGSRFQIPKQALTNGMPLIRFLANIFLSTIDRAVLKIPLTEFHTGFRVYNRELIESLPLENLANNYLFSFQIIAQAVYFEKKVVEVPVEADYHSAHTSHALLGAVGYAFSTFWVLLRFYLAKYSHQYHPMFPQRKKDSIERMVERKAA